MTIVNTVKDKLDGKDVPTYDDQGGAISGKYQFKGYIAQSSNNNSFEIFIGDTNPLKEGNAYSASLFGSQKCYFTETQKGSWYMDSSSSALKCKIVTLTDTKIVFDVSGTYWTFPTFVNYKGTVTGTVTFYNYKKTF